MSDLNDVIDRTLDMAAVDYDLKKKYDFRLIKIEKEYDSALPQVPCIPAEIEQVLLNLVRNAAQAMQENMPPGETPTIRVSTRKVGEYAQLELADNGPGMDQETQRRVFEPFFTTKKVGKGTGLGLSVSYFIVTDTHGGRFRVESEPGKGAIFIIDLPLQGKS
jgi:signal transduction histidine kinase